MLKKEAQHWDDTAEGWDSSVSNKVKGLAPSGDAFGMLKDAFKPYYDLLVRLQKLAAEGGQEFRAISETLNSASGQYQETEEQNTQAAKLMAGDAPTAGTAV